ncbi:hypothetical protein, partial [Staphylococcus pseudintermedius]|uniref:hypothetical protein n=1 Tax=Staphylococcus pseudintermedius TaxID=283734 RepID=UPI0036F3E93B
DNHYKFYNCLYGLAFLGADPSTNQRFDFNFSLVEDALVDFGSSTEISCATKISSYCPRKAD